MLEKLLQFLYPPVCAVCTQRLPAPGVAGSQLLCTKCNPLLTAFKSDRLLPVYDESMNGNLCRRCGMAAARDGHCLSCQGLSSPVNELRSIWIYTERTELAIKALKYGNRRRLAFFFGDCVRQALLLPPAAGGFSNKHWDLLVPVPSSSQLLRKRGFSHTALIIRAAAKDLPLRVSLFALRSKGRRTAQTALPARERLRNVKGKFTAVRSAVEGKRILLFDDVMTTGASMLHAAQALIAAGAGEVDGITLARSGQPLQAALYLEKRTYAA